MANVVLMWDDAITEIAATHIQTHSDETSGFAAENLLDSDRQTCYKASNTGDANVVHVRFDLGAIYSIAGFSIHNHNAGTKGVSNILVKASNDIDEGFTKATYDVSTYVGDDDFFHYFDSASSRRYWKIDFQSVDSAGLYIGRIGLWQSAYQLSRGIMPGSSKGYSHLEDVLTTKGGINHRISRGGLKRHFTGLVDTSSAAELAELEALIEHTEVNHKPFCTSWPGGTTSYTGANIYGAGVHAVIDAERWEYIMQVAGRGAPYLPIIEEL